MAAPSGATPILGLPYPIPNDDVDVPRDIKALADKLDTTKSIRATSVLASAPVLDVGQLGQARAGRQLTVADFTAMGLSAPAGLWNLSDLTDVSGNARALTNKGAVPFGVGINGQAVTAAAFAGSTGQALYIVDTGAADSFRIRTGSWGFWFRTAKRGVLQVIMSKWAPAAFSWYVGVLSTNIILVQTSGDGATASANLTGTTDVCDDRWHQVVVTYDATRLRIYVDGALDAGPYAGSGGLALVAAPLNIGGNSADAATATANPYYGRVDEAFVTADVLSDDQIRALYCASLAHGLGVAPSTVSLSVRRKRRGAALAVSDFPSQPVRLYNFVAGSLVDQGSSNIPLVANPGTGVITEVAAPDGAASGAKMLSGAHTGMSATDAGLPAALAARSYGIWFKTTAAPAAGNSMIGWGTLTTGDARLYSDSAGNLRSQSAADQIAGVTPVIDGLWHLGIVVEDNAAADGVKRKLYLDGRLIAGSTVLNSITPAGANRFRVGAAPDGIAPFVGQLARAFVYPGALTPEQVRALYNAGPTLLAASPKASADHIETLEATRMLATFDAIEPSDSIDVGVAA